MVILKAGSTERVDERRFEVGERYLYVMENKTDQSRQFTISSYISPYGGVTVVCSEYGHIPNPMSIERREELGWEHSHMGDIEFSRYTINEGYYIIKVITKDGFEALLGEEIEDDPTILITKIEELKECGERTMEMVVKVVYKSKASKFTGFGVVTDAVYDALDRVDYDFLAQSC